jgi:hypothetical protein
MKACCSIANIKMRYKQQYEKLSYYQTPTMKVEEKERVFQYHKDTLANHIRWLRLKNTSKNTLLRFFASPKSFFYFLSISLNP